MAGFHWPLPWDSCFCPGMRCLSSERLRLTFVGLIMNRHRLWKPERWIRWRESAYKICLHLGSVVCFVGVGEPQSWAFSACLSWTVFVYPVSRLGLSFVTFLVWKLQVYRQLTSLWRILLSGFTMDQSDNSAASRQENGQENTIPIEPIMASKAPRRSETKGILSLLAAFVIPKAQ